jgi:hypothetical protein
MAENGADISVNAPYRSDGLKFNTKGSKPNGPRCPASSLNMPWTPFGEVGSYQVDRETLLSVLMYGSPETPEPDFEAFFEKYKFKQQISDMADWFIDQGLAVEVLESPNTGVYVKVKADGSKLQVIADASLRNRSMAYRPKSFVLFAPDHAKEILREPGDTHLFSFDASNFYYAFILPELFHELFPVVFKIPDRDGSCRYIRCLRACFGDTLSPVLTHQALSDIFGVPSTVYIKGLVPKPHPCPWLDSKTDVSACYIDDVIDMGKNLEVVRARYTNKRERVQRYQIPVKPGSIKEGVSDLEFAGKRYVGRKETPFIANTRKNTVKLVALAIRLTEQKYVSSDFLKSLLGSFAFGTVHHKKALPFLSEVNKLAIDGRRENVLSDGVIHDVMIALQLTILPWLPGSEIVWGGYRPGIPLVVVDASAADGLVGMFLFDGEDEVWVASFTVPKKFNNSQQSAELYGLFIALKRGEERFGKTFDVISDSASSISSVTNLKMVATPKERNNLVRKVVRWSYLRPLKVSISWTDTKNNLADDPSREPIYPLNAFKLFSVREFKQFLCKSDKFFLSANQYAQK